MKQRLISGIALLLGLFLVVFKAPFPVFFLAFLIIAGLSIWEYSKLIYNDNPNLEPNRKWQWWYLLIIIVATLFPFVPAATVYFSLGTENYAKSLEFYKTFAGNTMFYAVFMWLFSLIIYRKTETLYNILHPRLVAIFAALINSAFFSALFVIRYIEPTTQEFMLNNSTVLMFYIFCLVVCADSGAYFVGRAIGKRKLCPTISPNKTVEGLLGGVLSAIICAVIFINFTSLGDNILTTKRLVAFIVFSIISVLFAVHGDLVESFIKRRAKVKDSSNLIPGHGGVLDRLDSLQPAFTFMAYFWVILTSNDFFTF
ncbi:phosphatidate cytidylyltransferase [Psittacicella hinzii]|uniref:Phosphatidate cytidylyltransferase n=1 Tax=Psittacicella hinzii TaxID=2028575 RepID=A0A3A1YFF9_9GAMM|nr:CDP-archaeol synthase [Psittacicella hinzii]RIY36176.1 hypothetical protein CKF58_06175 [Psittacicella hinzii]